MKTVNYFSLAFLCFCLTATSHAQITLTAATHTPVSGDTFDYYSFASPAIVPGAGGTDQIWDFSGLGTGTATAVSYDPASTGGDVANHPNADLVGTYSPSSGQDYLITSADGLAFDGRFIPATVREVYTDKRETLKFPFSYGDVYNETFSGTVENLAAPLVLNRGGTEELRADAYGDLILPYGTISDVLRIRLVNNYSDELGGTTFFDYIDTIYFWYHASTSTFIASHTTLYANGFLAGVSASYLQEGTVSTGIEANLETSIEVYPNPTTDFVIVKDIPASGSIELYNNAGELLFQEAVFAGTDKRIDLSKLESGVYILRNVSLEGTRSSKIILE